MSASSRNPDRRPTHPGAVLREDVLPELGITQATLASHLGVSRFTVSELLHEKRALTAEMAVRVSTVVGGPAVPLGRRAHICLGAVLASTGAQ